MQNRQQMLASPRAQATYVQFQRQGIAATVCRGTTDDEFNFFYSDLTHWADNCLGWVIDSINKSKICTHCSLSSPLKVKIEPKSDINEFRKESRDSNRSPGQPTAPSKPGSPEIRGVCKVHKHGGKGNKDLPAVKNKKTKRVHTRKRKNGKEISKK
jgi:hypothetical protein